MSSDDTATDEPAPDEHSDVPWQRLDTRVVWVDGAKALLSLVPITVATAFFDARLDQATMIPVLTITGAAFLGGLMDLLRWAKTRYRVTDEYVERRSGWVVRQHRSIRRDRIRSVDTSAKLRHRLTGLRIVTIGSGQSGLLGAASLILDAVRADTAEQLRRDLLHGVRPAPSESEALEASDAPEAAEPAGQVLARLDRRWVIHNTFSIWAFLTAAGLIWGTYWTADIFGLDLAGFVRGLADWDAVGPVWTTVLAVAVTGVIGVAGLAVNFFTANWRFTLARVPVEGRTILRTTQGLFKTREVNRDDERLRGVQITEPLLWRWLGTADTHVISTGLTFWSVAPSAQILPRGPVSVARRVTADVLGAGPSPVDRSLRPHPRRALRRRAGWAVSTTAVVTGLLAVLTVLIDALPDGVWLAGLGVLPVGLALALVAYRSLGHTVADGYLVTRSGAWNRTTAALQSRAVVGVNFRQSLLQRRLGLVTVEATTAAGLGAYAAIDVAAADAVDLADAAVPGLLTPFRAATERSAAPDPVEAQARP